MIEDKRNVRPYFAQIGKHFAAERDFAAAEKMFLEGGAANEAVTMYCDAGMTENKNKSSFIICQFYIEKKIIRFYSTFFIF